MTCEAEYCVYNRQHRCLLNETHIDALGMCGECVMVSLDKDLLEVEKERQLREMERGSSAHTEA